MKKRFFIAILLYWRSFRWKSFSTKCCSVCFGSILWVFTGEVICSLSVPIHLKDLIRPVLEYASPVWGGLPIYLEEDLQRVQNRCLNVIGLPRDTVESLVTRRQNLTRKEFKRILESEAHPCKRFLDKPVDHGHNLRSCKTNPAQLMHNDWHIQVCCSEFARFPAAVENSFQSPVAHRLCISWSWHLKEL